MSEQASVFTNDRILNWMKYFSDRTELDVETTKLMDVSVKNKNVIPAVEANRWVLVFADAGYPSLFYDMWNAGLGECRIWLKEGVDPEGDVTVCRVSELIDRGITGPCAMLIENPQADSAYKIGLQNQRFSKGSVRYVAHEIRAAMMSMLRVRSHDTICIISGESIAVEAAMSAGEGTIIAVEYNDGDRASMEENVNKFGLNNVQIIPDMEPETLKTMPVPTTAFIVAAANLENEIKALLALNPNMRFMIYTLELNVLAEIPSLFAKYEIHDMEALQIAVSKLRKNGMFETKPVPWIISGQAGEGAAEELH